MTRRKRTKGSKSPLIRLVGLEARLRSRRGRHDRPTCHGGARRPRSVVWRCRASVGHRDPSTLRATGRSTCRTTTPCCSGAEASTAITVLLRGLFHRPTAAERHAGCELCGRRCRKARSSTTRHCSPTASSSALARQQPDGEKLLVFRLRPDGALDPGFRPRWTRHHQRRQHKPRGGLFGDCRPGRPHRRGGLSATISLLVARLLANGTLDTGFGSGGIFVASEPGGYGASAHRARSRRRLSRHGAWPAGAGHRRYPSSCSGVWPDGRRRPRCCVRYRRNCCDSRAGGESVSLLVPGRAARWPHAARGHDDSLPRMATSAGYSRTARSDSGFDPDVVQRD